MFGPFRKEKPLQGFMGFGGGAAAISKSGGAMAPTIDATGGHVSDVSDPDGNIYRYHVFNAPGSFVVSDLGASDGVIQFLLVAGGGAGGYPSNGGGGGAGGVTCTIPGLTAHPTCTGSPITLPGPGTTPVVVGNGGHSWPDGKYEQNKGYDTVFEFPNSPTSGTRTAHGGGGGGTYQGPTDRRAGSPGGSGGGGGSNESDPSPTPTGSQGYGTPNLDPGPGNNQMRYFGIGGGGAGGAGNSGNQRSTYGSTGWGGGSVSPTSKLLGMGGAGGLGAVMTGMPGLDATQIGVPGPTSGIWFAGGGGGGTRDGYWNPNSAPTYGNDPTASPNPGKARAGGAGGGGQGASGSGYAPSVPFEPGALLPKGGRNWEFYPNRDPAPLKQCPGGQMGAFMTGGGGGGGGYEWGGGSAGDGGPGFGIVRYIISSAQTGSAKATGGLISATPTHIIHTFLQPGTFVVNAGFSETCEYVVLGGGGAAGGGKDYRYIGGGGGAGGYLTGTTAVAHPAPLTVEVGQGGDGGNGAGVWPGQWWSQGPTDSFEPARKNGLTPGQPSSVNFPAGTITAHGGGAGGCGPNWPTTRSWPVTDVPYRGTKGQPGGSGGGTAGHNPGTDPTNAGGLGNREVCDENAPVPSQGNNGGSANCEDQAMGGGGGGAGGAGGSCPTTCNPTGQPTANRTTGAGGVGVRLPTTFHNPNGHQFAPGPAGAYYVAGGGAGGCLAGSSGPPTNPSPQSIPTGVDATLPASGGYGGGGDTNTVWISGPPTMRNRFWHNTTAHGVNGCGGGGGAGSCGGPPSYQAMGGMGGSGVVLIAYPV